MTGNAPAPSAVNNYAAALATVSVNVMGGQGTLPSSRYAMTATTSNFVYKGASIVREHVERDAAVKCSSCTMSAAFREPGLRCRDICLLSSGTAVVTAVDLTWLLVCVRCEV